MSDDELRHLVTEYCAGLEAEIALLRQLKRLSGQQQEAGARGPDFDRFAALADERDRVLAGLVTVEHEIRPLREKLLAEQADVAASPHYPELVRLHRSAGELVATIIAADQSTLSALRAAETARRSAAQTLETGEATLAAYRRVIAPDPPGASLLDRKG